MDFTGSSYLLRTVITGGGLVYCNIKGVLERDEVRVLKLTRALKTYHREIGWALSVA